MQIYYLRFGVGELLSCRQVDPITVLERTSIRETISSQLNLSVDQLRRGRGLGVRVGRHADVHPHLVRLDITN